MPPDLSGLTPSQLEWVESVIRQFKLPANFQCDPVSDWISEAVLNRLGDAMRIHHAFSRQALSKDRFEYAFERALSLCQIPAELVRSRTNRGHDLTIAGVPVSLKTEAAANIKTDMIHVSKWMELERPSQLGERRASLGPPLPSPPNTPNPIGRRALRR